MARSLKKGPFVDLHLFKKIEKNKQENRNAPIKTWSRRSTIFPDFVGQTFAVHNGFSLPRIWLVISWASFRRLVPSTVTRLRLRDSKSPGREVEVSRLGLWLRRQLSKLRTVRWRQPR